jgi:hypothetical protein
MWTGIFLTWGHQLISATTASANQTKSSVLYKQSHAYMFNTLPTKKDRSLDPESGGVRQAYAYMHQVCEKSYLSMLFALQV